MHAPERAQREIACTFFDAPAGDFDVLGLQRGGDLRDGQVISAQLVAFEKDVDLAFLSADDRDLTYAVNGFKLAAHGLVGELGHLAHRTGRCDGKRHDRRSIGVHFLHRRLFDVGRQVGQREVELVAYVLRRRVQVAVQIELHDNQRDALCRSRTQRLDAADGVKGFFDLVADFGFDFLRRGTGQHGGDNDRWELDAREAFDLKARIRKQSQYHQRHNQHRGEDGTTNTNFS